MKLIAVLVGILVVGMASAGIYSAWSQARKISTYWPIEARILDRRVEVRRGKHTTYRPKVAFSYEVNGRSYTSRKLAPIEESFESRGAAEEVIAGFKVGGAATAYRSPRNPADAFLLRRYSFTPYILILLSVPISLGLFLALGNEAAARRAGSLLPVSNGWFEAMPALPVRARASLASSSALLWIVVGLLSSGHYFLVAGPSPSTESVVATALYGGLALVPVAMALYYLLLARNAGEARVLLDRQRLSAGDEVRVRTEQEFHRPVEVKELRLGFWCQEKISERRGGKRVVRTRKPFEDWRVLAADMRFDAGRPATLEETFFIPAGGPVSTPPGKRGYPQRRWRLSIRARLAGSPDYRSDFTVIVEPAAAPAAVEEAGARGRMD